MHVPELNGAIPQIEVILTEDSQRQFSDLLDHCFNVPAGQNYFHDFPVWDPRFKAEAVARLGVFVGKKLVSAAAVRITSLKVGSPDLLKVAILGAVATLPAFQGRGFASRLATVAVEWAKSQNAAWIMLWGSQHSLYRRLGFELCGEQYQVPLKDVVSKETPDGVVHTGWNPALFKMLRSRRDGLVLKEKDLQWYEAHRNVSWYHTGSVDRPSAYAALGRGIDLAGVVHEWGGDPAQLKSILKYIHEENEGILLLGNSYHLSNLGNPPLQESSQYLCMAKILNPAILQSTFYPGQPIGNYDFLSFPFWIWGLDAA